MSRPDKHIAQSSAIPYIVEDAETKVVLITSHSTGSWIIPKGIVEPGMTPSESAANEALEEAGVRGEIGTEVIASYDHKKWGRVCRVDVFSLAVSEILDEWDEMHSRNRRVVKLEDAIKLVNEQVRTVLQRFAQQHLP